MNAAQCVLFDFTHGWRVRVMLINITFKIFLFFIVHKVVTGNFFSELSGNSKCKSVKLAQSGIAKK